MGWFNHNISVTLIDDASGSVIGTTEMNPADLPESFKLATTLHLGDGDWSVIQATPETRSDYSKSRKLVLRLRRIEKIDLRNILYSLPSICDGIPALGNRSVSGSDLVLHEDDWRQLELVSRRFAQEADREIEAIHKIHTEERAQVGWRKIHVRRGPEAPIAPGISLHDITGLFNVRDALHGVTYQGAQFQIESGFSFTASDGQQFYGTAQDGAVTVFAVVQKHLPSTPLKSIELLETMAGKFELDLIQWCRCERTAESDPLFRKVLTENASAQ